MRHRQEEKAEFAEEPKEQAGPLFLEARRTFYQSILQRREGAPPIHLWGAFFLSSPMVGVPSSGWRLEVPLGVSALWDQNLHSSCAASACPGLSSVQSRASSLCPALRDWKMYPFFFCHPSTYLLPYHHPPRTLSLSLPTGPLSHTSSSFFPPSLLYPWGGGVAAAGSRAPLSHQMWPPPLPPPAPDLLS